MGVARRFAAGARVFDPVLDDRGGHASEQLLLRAGPGGAGAASDTALVERRAAKDARAVVVLHPGSGARRKCWPAPRLAELARALARHAPVQVVLGPAERERGLAAAWPRDVELITPADALALAELLSRAHAFVGHDSGPTHLAAALRVPTVALFVATNPVVWAPLGAHVRVVEGVVPPAVVIEHVAALAR